MHFKRNSFLQRPLKWFLFPSWCYFYRKCCQIATLQTFQDSTGTFAKLLVFICEKQWTMDELLQNAVWIVQNIKINEKSKINKKRAIAETWLWKLLKVGFWPLRAGMLPLYGFTGCGGYYGRDACHGNVGCLHSRREMVFRLDSMQASSAPGQSIKSPHHRTVTHSLHALHANAYQCMLN